MSILELNRAEIIEAIDAAIPVSHKWGSSRGRRQTGLGRAKLLFLNTLKNLPEEATVRELREALEDGEQGS